MAQAGPLISLLLAPWRFLDSRLSALHKLLALAIALAAPLTFLGWFSWSETQKNIDRVDRQLAAVAFIDGTWRTLIDVAEAPATGIGDSANVSDAAAQFQMSPGKGADEVGVGPQARAFAKLLATPGASRAAQLASGADLIAEACTSTSLGLGRNEETSWTVWTIAWTLPPLLTSMDRAYSAALTAPPTGADMNTWRAFDAFDTARGRTLNAAHRTIALSLHVGTLGAATDALDAATANARAKFDDLVASRGPSATPFQHANARGAALQAEQTSVHAADAATRDLLARTRQIFEARKASLSARRRGTAAFGLFILSIAGMCAAALAKSIMEPQLRLAQAMRRIALGETDTPAPYVEYRNEVGDMARSVEVFRQTMITRNELQTSLENERKALEARVVERTRELENANTAKTDFVASLSHEIRTPLNGVLGMAAALSQTNLDSRQQDMLRVITASGDVLLRLLNNSIDIARIESGEFELDIAPFDLSEMVDVAASLYRPSAHAKGLWFDVGVAPEVLGAYRGDVVRLRQILQNFVSNAVKFTETGGVTVTVARVDQRDNRVRLKFEVSDTGIGLPHDGDLLFKRYSQARSGRGFEGTGLGLAICRDLAALMGGRVRAKPRPGGPGRFELEIALERVAAAPMHAAQTHRPLTGAHVLAAEDNSMNRLVLAALLEQAGITAEMVQDGVQALEAARARPFDAILMDLHMPLLDGLAAARTIRALGGPNQHTPILALTADALPAQIRACREAGMNGHIAKPIRVDELFAALAEALAQAPQSRQAERAAG